MAAAQASLQAGAFGDALELLVTAEAGPLDEFQKARVDLLRGQIAFASGLGSDAPPLLLAAARRSRRTVRFQQPKPMAAAVTDRNLETHANLPIWAASGRLPGAAEQAENGCSSCLQELAEQTVNGRTFALDAIGGAGVSAQLGLAGRAVAWTRSAMEKAQSGDPHTNTSQGDLGRRDDLE